MKTEGDLDPALLEKSMNVLIQRYEVFRTVFVYKGMTKPRQVVLKERKFKIGVRDLSHLPESERTDAFSQLLRQDQETPFDLSKDILWRVTVVHMGEGRHHFEDRREINIIILGTTIITPMAISKFTHEASPPDDC